MMGRGILITAKGDLAIANGHLVVGDTLLQDTSIVLGMNQGELKEDPLLGPNLLSYTRGNKNVSDMERVIKIHLSRAGIGHEEVKHKLNIILNNHEESNRG